MRKEIGLLICDVDPITMRMRIGEIMGFKTEDFREVLEIRFPDGTRVYREVEIAFDEEF